MHKLVHKNSPEINKKKKKKSSGRGLNEVHTPVIECPFLSLGGNIMCVSRLVLLLGLLLCVGAQLSSAQHWSHGWYPGGKRELDSFGTSEVRISVCVPVCILICREFPVENEGTFCLFTFLYSPKSALCVSQISEEIKLCEAGECSYLRPQRRSILRNIIVSVPCRFRLYKP